MFKKDKKDIAKPPILFDKTQQIIKKIESLTQKRLICYWNSFNGSVCQNDVMAFYEILKGVKQQDDFMLFIKSDGGDGKASLRIINLIRQHTKHLTALIQSECASAATMLAIGANEIQMAPLGFLTAVDTSLTHSLSPIDKNNNLVSVSQDELQRVISMWNNQKNSENAYHDLFPYVHPLVIGAVDRASSLSIKLCKEILSYHMEDLEKANIISQKLNADYPSHSYPITLKEAKKIGLNAVEMDEELNNLLFELNETYSEMGQQSNTDYDENSYHDHEIRNIIEATNTQIYYQVDKDWFYRSEERRYIPMNDLSSWRINTMNGNKSESRRFYIS